MEVAAALGATVVARCDRVVLEDVWKRCGWSLAAFDAAVWPLALVCRRRQGGMAAEVTRRARWFVAVWGCVEVLHGRLGMFGD